MRHLEPVRPHIGESAFAGFRFPPEVITVAVRWYLRYGLSYRDVEELLAERGIEFNHVTIYRWVQRFTPLFADAARPARPATGDRWFVDETYVKVSGRWLANSRIAELVGVSRPTVIGWRSRYAARGLAGLEDEPRPGRPRHLDHRQIVAATLRPPPRKYGVTHWSSRLLAGHLKIGDATLARAWREYGVAPSRAESFRFSTDPSLSSPPSVNVVMIRSGVRRPPSVPRDTRTVRGGPGSRRGAPPR